MKYLISILLLLNPTLSLGGEQSGSLNAEIRALEAELQEDQREYKDRPNLTSLATAKEVSHYIKACMKKVVAPENMAASREAKEGTASKSLTIYPSGIIKNIGTVKSSGNHATDKAIHQTILNASPCQEFPETLNTAHCQSSMTGAM